MRLHPTCPAPGERLGSQHFYLHIVPMAKKQKQKSNSFEFETISKKEATTRKSQRGQRRSKYSPIGEQFEDLGKKDVLTFEASKNEVQGIRNYMRRNYEGQHEVSSRRGSGDHFEVFISKN